LGGGTGGTRGYVSEHLGDHWEPHLMDGPAADDPWNAATADVTVRGMMLPWYASQSNNGYKVEEGQGAYFYAERDPETLQIMRWQGHLINPGELIHVSRTVPHFFFVMGGEPLRLTFMGVKMSACFGDRVSVDLAELQKEWMITLRAVVQGYEGDVCSVLCQEGTQMDIHNANQLFGFETDAEPGITVEFNIRFPALHPKRIADEAQTTNPEKYEGPMPPPDPFTDE